MYERNFMPCYGGHYDGWPQKLCPFKNQSPIRNFFPPSLSYLKEMVGGQDGMLVSC